MMKESKGILLHGGGDYCVYLEEGDMEEICCVDEHSFWLSGGSKSIVSIQQW